MRKEWGVLLHILLAWWHKPLVHLRRVWSSRAFSATGRVWDTLGKSPVWEQNQKLSRSYFAPPKRLSIQLFERLQTTNLFPFLLSVFYSSAGDWRLKGEALEIQGWERGGWKLTQGLGIACTGLESELLEASVPFPPPSTQRQGFRLNPQEPASGQVSRKTHPVPSPAGLWKWKVLLDLRTNKSVFPRS